MERQSMVREVVVTIDGHPRKATYFVEADSIHVMIENRSFLLAAGPGNPEGTVKAVLLEHCLQGEGTTGLNDE